MIQNQTSKNTTQTNQRDYPVTIWVRAGSQEEAHQNVDEVLANSKVRYSRVPPLIGAALYFLGGLLNLDNDLAKATTDLKGSVKDINARLSKLGSLS